MKKARGLLIPGVLTAILLFPSFLSANKEVDWASRQMIQSLVTCEDPKSDMSLEAVKNLSDHQFSKAGIHQNFGFTTSAWWLRFNLENTTGQDERCLLRLANGHIHDIQFFLVGADETINYQTGNYYSNNSKPLRFTEYLFPLELKAGRNYTVYLKLAKRGAELSAPLQILSREYDYATIFNGWNLLFGATFLYIAILFICTCIIRTPVILFYFIYACCLCLYMASTKGVSFAMLWPNQPWIQTNVLELSKHLANIFYILFIMKFIGWNSQYPRINAFLKTCILLSGLNILFRLTYSVSEVIPDILMMRFVQLTSLLLPIADAFLVYLLYQSWKITKKTEVFWLLFITAGLIIPLIFLVSLHFGWIPALALYPNLLVIMFLIEIICISAIIVYRYYELYKKELYHLREITNLKKKAVENILLGQEEERIRIAKDLHDGISLSLAHIRMRLSSFEAQLIATSQKTVIRELLDQLGNTSKEVRSISHNLAPLSLQHQELTKAIEELVYQIELVDANMDIEFYYPEDINKSLSPMHKQNIYQIVKELFNNILKYAQASHIELRFSRDQDSFQLVIEDNGKPYNPDAGLNGLGLASIKSRATLLNGWFTILPRHGGGMLHQFKIPVSG
ncbi:MAG: 7TM-DISM domain-containing protein [Saprospiraceae bacterium]|nr:7TM-DISM domain-containing protein [Saprospiraceae bacterium]